jgi:ketosteroid isomerase-like protein
MPDVAIDYDLSLPEGATGAATRLVARYLRAMERRDLDAARAMQAPGFTMTFPGANRFTELDDLIAWSRPRYRNIRKQFERFDEAPTPDGTAVYSVGTLHGEWPDGSPVDGVRYIDRFTVKDGLLADQNVWNDMAEMRDHG